MDKANIWAAMDATWPAAEMNDTIPGWRIRRGAGGGKRVSSATVTGEGDIAAAEAAMLALNQPPMFQLTSGDDALDVKLAELGYQVVDPVILYAAPAAALAEIPPRKGVRAVRVRTRLVLLDELWEAGGVGPGRRAVMTRAADPKTVLMARTDMNVGGCAFVGVHGDLAMIHAIEVSPDQRRKGAGAELLAEAARFGLDHGAATLALAVTRANTPARALYEGLGMAEAACYHYRIAP